MAKRKPRPGTLLPINPGNKIWACRSIANDIANAQAQIDMLEKQAGNWRQYKKDRLQDFKDANCPPAFLQ